MSHAANWGNVYELQILIITKLPWPLCVLLSHVWLEGMRQTTKNCGQNIRSQGKD
jgi:hypothetical protein